MYVNFITNLKPGLGAYWEIYEQTTWTILRPSCEDSPGRAPSMHGTRYFTVQDWNPGTRHSLRILG